MIAATGLLWACGSSSNDSAKDQAGAVLSGTLGLFSLPDCSVVRNVALHNYYDPAAIEIRVRNGSGALVAAGPLGRGTPDPRNNGECDFSFSVADVPRESVLTLELEPVYQGSATLTASELDRVNWHVTLGCSKFTTGPSC